MMQLDVKLATKAEALDCLRKLEASGEWERLLAGSSQATSFQHPAFALSWYETYAGEWEPLAIVATNQGKELAGLWLLAREAANPARITHAGAHQAEYHSWIARPECEVEFVRAAWERLRRLSSLDGFRFKYLPNTACEEVLRAAIGSAGSLSIVRHERPLLMLDATELAKNAAKKANRSKLNRLKRLGTLSFRRLTTAAEFDQYFPVLIDLYDFRQGSINGCMPFREDGGKTRFHERLFALFDAQRLYVSVTLLDDVPIAGFFGLISKDTVHLGLLMSDAVLAASSPGKLHLMQAAADMCELGFRKLDLTPGGDPWKTRFANASDGVLEASFTASRLSLVAATATARVASVAKRSLHQVGISPQQLRTALKLMRKLNFERVSRVARTWMREEREYRIYAIARSDTRQYQPDPDIRRNQISDLLAFRPHESWQDLAGFLGEAGRRLENGDLVFTQVDHGELVHSGWLTLHPKQSVMTEVQQTMDLPDRCAVLWDFYTAPGFRGRGAYRRNLNHMLAYAFAQDDIDLVYIGVLANNLPSRRVIEQLGFEYQGSAFMERRYGQNRTWNTLKIGEQACAS